MTTVCRALDFCANLDCWFCTQVLLNPECWPTGAIALMLLLLYVVVASIYILLYVPMTIGKPIRLLLQTAVIVVLFLTRRLRAIALAVFRRMIARRRRTRSQQLAAALAVVICCTIQNQTTVEACQHVNVFQHRSTTCTRSNGQETCHVALTELLKISTFHQDASLRLTHNSTLIANVKIRWKGLYLSCEQETLYFTRSTSLRVLDSKRCPHMGSCVKDECANINTSSLLPELNMANQFPGRTGCLESCGGPGCDCFYLSSGCLFYRVYAVPHSPRIYEIFRCIRWSEEVKLEITLETANHPKGKQRFIEPVVPNVPVSLPFVQITMTSLTLPPTPSLNKDFVTDGHDTAIWLQKITPHLICSPKGNANLNNCSVRPPKARLTATVPISNSKTNSPAS
ncbi:unnamed protein product [Heligmosomoides polygyrus]|uniref:Phlebovirus_G2 domain-containing protein n=1 Tax=Heligmosomoides polygyrus TaxID=6339 RepID=A0A183GSF9_HELPZ|nr:unnamed protein product [Heligmosomoides polygyrus]